MLGLDGCLDFGLWLGWLGLSVFIFFFKGRKGKRKHIQLSLKRILNVFRFKAFFVFFFHVNQFISQK
jgi:hypothetical protein